MGHHALYTSAQIVLRIFARRWTNQTTCVLSLLTFALAVQDCVEYDYADAEGLDVVNGSKFTLLNDAYDGSFFAAESHMMSAHLHDEMNDMKECFGHVEGPNAHSYEEVNAIAAMEMLRDMDLAPGSRFYDLGSGVGKLVSVAWLMGLNATGIEYSQARSRRACVALERLRRKQISGSTDGALQHVHGDASLYDFSDADFVFSNNLAFGTRLMQRLAHTAWALREGAIIVAAKAFPNPSEGPKLLEIISGVDLTDGGRDGWGYMHDFVVQRRTEAPWVLEAHGSRLPGCPQRVVFDQCSLSAVMLSA